MLRENVLRKKNDFTTIYNKGKSIGSKHVVLIYKKNGLSVNRFGFLASKKVGNSVVRNRARRLMKESYRKVEYNLQVGYDFIFVARNGIHMAKCDEVYKSIKFLLKKAGIIEGK